MNPKFQVGQELILTDGQDRPLPVTITQIEIHNKQYGYKMDGGEGFPMYLSEPVLLRVLEKSNSVLGRVVVDTVFVPCPEVRPDVVPQFDVVIS